MLEKKKPINNAMKNIKLNINNCNFIEFNLITNHLIEIICKNKITGKTKT